MPINKETIISVFDDKLTLMQWLKTINKALEDAVLTGVEINKKGNATLSFKFTFEDGTFLETNDIVLQQGESVANAFIQNGHLYLTLTNGTNLDAGNVKPVSSFAINASGHLIVNYGDGTSQDLGSLGDFSNVDFVAKTLTQNEANFSRVLEVSGLPSWARFEQIYSVLKVINGVLHVIIQFSVENLTNEAKTPYLLANFYAFNIPQSIGSKIYDYLGQTLDQTIATETTICVEPCTALPATNMATNTKNAFFVLGNAQGANALLMRVQSGQGIPFEPNEKLYFSARIALTLI